jgi:hypothetical protein
MKCIKVVMIHNLYSYFITDLEFRMLRFSLIFLTFTLHNLTILKIKKKLIFCQELLTFGLVHR